MHGFSIPPLSHRSAFSNNFLKPFFFFEWENAYKGVDLKENTQPKSYEFQFYLGTSLRMIAWERAF